MALSGFPSNVHFPARSASSIVLRIGEFAAALHLADILVFGCILFFGGLQFFSVQRVADFQRDDVFYADAGRSLVQHHFYGINGHAETNQPPGLPFLLGLLALSGNGSRLAYLRVMAIFEALGFLVTYELLRRQTSRVVAASICVLMISSRVFFLMATQWVFPSLPYFFTSMGALLVARKFERSTNTATRVVWGTLLTLLMVASLSFASAGMAFLAAIAASTGVLFYRNRQLAVSRTKLYLAVLLVVAVAQGLWMHRKASPLEWPIPGYPQSYLSQLKVKSGNEPQLGMATLSDIPSRILRNAADDSVVLSQILLRRWVDSAWMSVLVTGPIVLILLGWGSSVWQTGGDIQDWYFAAYQSMYLLWPWKTETRFFLPIAPLACLYIWRGGKSLITFAIHRPRLLGLAWYPLAVILAVSSWFWMNGSWIGSHLTHAGLQDETSFVIWILSAILAVRMLWAEDSWRKASNAFRDWCYLPNRSIGVNPLRISQILAMVGALALIVIGLGSQLALARTNLNLNSKTNSIPPDVLAAQWINSNTEETAVIMARHVPITYHFANRKIVWFPPSSNPQLLIEGILRHKIDYAIVVTREYSYYLPPEEDCMAALLASHPGAFDLVYQGAEFKIFRVRHDAAQPQLTDAPSYR